MISPAALLDDLKRLLGEVEADLRARSGNANVPEIGERLHAEYDRAFAAKRTAATYEEWRADRLTQAAVAWLLSCVFVRFLEDNDLIAPPRLAGPGSRLQQAQQAAEHYFLTHRYKTNCDYLLSVFDELAAVQGTAGIFGPHNALREIPTWLSGDAAGRILEFFQRIDANTGNLIHDFTDPEWGTRFLGDLYQNLSAYARERYALLQTPHFIEQFLLDRTLEPAIAEFDLQDFRMIDPACGSGHIILGSFARILDRWQRTAPATPVRELVLRTLASVNGVDINPFAVAIARFRLLLVAMKACGVRRLVDTPAFKLNIECGDSLLHSHRELFNRGVAGQSDEEHAYATENLQALRRILRHGQCHAVIANPPYITPKDPGLRERYRNLFPSCSGKYSLAVPFMEHIFKLGVPGGFTGQITTNAFMRRNYGKKLIHRFFPTVDLTHVVDTSGADIPYHGTTPTAILFGRNRPPLGDTVRTVMGIRGEPTTPLDPARGRVWTAITTQIDEPGSQSEYISVADLPRSTFHSHPWSIGGGGAIELKQTLDQAAGRQLGKYAAAIGITAVTGEDELYMQPEINLRRLRIDRLRPLVVGELIRDWTIAPTEQSLWTYDEDFEVESPQRLPRMLALMWPYRAGLKTRRRFGTPMIQRGATWYEWQELYSDKLQTPLTICFAAVATHNHFLLDRGGKVFKQSAPVIKLPADATYDDYFAITGLLNSSTACFWMKQVFYPKASSSGDISVEKGKPEANRYDIDGTGLGAYPIPDRSVGNSSIARIAKAIDECASHKTAQMPGELVYRWATNTVRQSLRELLSRGAIEYGLYHQQMIALQEELDWEGYHVYGLTDAGASDPILNSILSQRLGIAVSLRPYAWSDDNPPHGIPSEWLPIYTERRRLIDALPSIGLIEVPVYKRPWWGRQGVYGRLARDYSGWQAEALEKFLLDRLERIVDFDGRMNEAGSITATLPIALISIGQFADAARQDPLFMEAAEIFRDGPGFDAKGLVQELVEAESVPLLPVLRYKPKAMEDKRRAWERTWELQRQEDAIDARTDLPPTDPEYLTKTAAADLKDTQVGTIPVPPRYVAGDFLKPSYWRLRGGLDVPKERFVSFPHVTGRDGSMMIAWAGYDHLQLAKAIGDFYGVVRTEIGGSDDPRLVPLLACILELLPWIAQWHPDRVPPYPGKPAKFFSDFVRQEAIRRGMTVEAVRDWKPPPARRGGRRRRDPPPEQ